MSTQNIKKHRILITGGHLTPALAVHAELKKRGYSNFLWVGHKKNQSKSKSISAEYQIVTNEGVKFINLRSGKLIRKWTRETFLNGLMQIIYLKLGFIKAFYIILRYRPKLIMSFGGFLAVPIVFWGKIFRVKVITHEQTIVVGLANKIISKFADKILISWEESKKFFTQKKVIFTGNPIRREIFSKKSECLTKEFDPKLPILYITGGNQGAHEINKRVFEILDKLLEDFNVIHQTGSSSVTGDYLFAKEFKNKLTLPKKCRYAVRDFIDAAEIGEAFQKSNLILSRAGANTVTEILATGKLCILIPIPWASNNEQFLNANLVKSTGLGYILEQNDALSSQQLYSVILNALSLIKSGKDWINSDLEECQKRASSLITLDAPVRVANEIEKTMSKL
jgi:UDP-N-acetylglucosamine--N-acetylmuramyl-(pentapeptide) pyrophosphoryl-undecaprenol N-acetylglucosamine transferase